MLYCQKIRNMQTYECSCPDQTILCVYLTYCICTQYIYIFDFNIVNFPFLSSNIPQSPAYGVYVSQLIRYARASSAYSDFLVRSRLLTGKLLGQGYNRFKLITTFKKFYGRHYDLIGKFQHSVTHMVTDLFLETLFLQ